MSVDTMLLAYLCFVDTVLLFATIKGSIGTGVSGQPVPYQNNFPYRETSDQAGTAANSAMGA